MQKKVIAMLRKHEGMRNYPYKCSEGFLTLGIGRNLETNGITEDEAIYLLENDIERVINQLKKNNFIETKIIVDKQTKQVKKRIIKIKDTIHKNDDRGIYKNDKVYIYNNNNNINNNKYEKIKINFKDYPKEVQGLFLSLEKIFQSKFLPKTKKQKKEWVKAIDDLWRLDDYHPRKVYIILDKVSKDDFWNKNCNTILKLRRTNKDKIKYIDYFDSIFANHLKNKNFDKYPDKRRST